MIKTLLVLITFLGSALAADNPPSVIVIFGATGDLTGKKLIPALEHLDKAGNLSENSAIVGVARRDLTHEEFRKQVGAPDAFQNKIFYHQLGFESSQDYDGLKQFLAEIDGKFGTKGNRLFYLATQPKFFSTIIKELKTHLMIDPLSNIIIEKPFGVDLESAIALQDEISKHLDESQIYRIDHYLGKEGVQNILKLRFEQKLFEPFWSHHSIDHVQITLSEEQGIGTRGSFWEETGALRDLFQNHLMQILALIAMEAPVKPELIHQEKIKALDAIRPFPLDQLDHYVIRGQYGPGIVKGAPVLGYRQEQQVAQDSHVETYIAAKMYIDNERWKGVPFYLQAGKRLAKQTVEIAVHFKDSTVLFIRVQPETGIFLKTSEKDVPLLLGDTAPEAYEKLLYDCLQDDKSLFVEAEEHFAAWKILTPVLDYWKTHPPEDFPNYAAGTSGPEAAKILK